MIPTNLLDSVVLNNTAGAADLEWTGNDYRLLTVTGLGTPLNLDDIIHNGFQHKPYTVGTPQETTLDFAAHIFAVGVVETIVIIRSDNGHIKTYSIMPSTTSASDAAILFQNQINADPTRWADVVAAGDTCIFTQLVDTGGFAFIQFPSLTISATGTQYDAPSGLYSEVVKYDANALAGGEFDGYLFYSKYEQQNSNTTNFGDKKMMVIVWVEINGGGHGAFHSRFIEILTASDIPDAEIQPYVRVIHS